jgi:hypothetical protein
VANQRVWGEWHYGRQDIWAQPIGKKILLIDERFFLEKRKEKKKWKRNEKGGLNTKEPRAGGKGNPLGKARGSLERKSQSHFH